MDISNDSEKSVLKLSKKALIFLLENDQTDGKPIESHRIDLFIKLINLPIKFRVCSKRIIYLIFKHMNGRNIA